MPTSITFEPIMSTFVVVFLGEIHVFNQHIEWKYSSHRNGMCSCQKKIAEIISKISSKLSKNIVFVGFMTNFSSVDSFEGIF